MCRNQFLERYNPLCSVDAALDQAINVSVLRNPTYTIGLNGTEKIIFRNYWRERLIEIGRLFSIPKDRNFYLDNIQILKTEMNNRFYNSLQPLRRNYDNGFRIAHSQKSISIYLKHLWCMSLIPEPPCCPIDRRILIISGINSRISWTRINQLAEVQDILNQFTNVANQNNLSLSNWECQLFQNGQYTT